MWPWKSVVVTIILSYPAEFAKILFGLVPVADGKALSRVWDNAEREGGIATMITAVVVVPTSMYLVCTEEI